MRQHNLSHSQSERDCKDVTLESTEKISVAIYAALYPTAALKEALTSIRKHGGNHRFAKK